MKGIGKINIKYFLNKNLKSKEGIVIGYENNKPIFSEYPLYIKITFKRKSTEIKSLISNQFSTIDDAYTHFNNDIKIETKLIEDIIKKGFNELGDNFSLKGITLECSKYQNIYIENCLFYYVLNDFEDFISKSQYAYPQIFSIRIPSVPSIEYFKIACKIFNNDPLLCELDNRFRIQSKIEKIIIDGQFFQNIPIIHWKYGNTKLEFIEIAKKLKIKIEDIETIINCIDSHS